MRTTPYAADSTVGRALASHPAQRILQTLPPLIAYLAFPTGTLHVHNTMFLYPPRI